MAKAANLADSLGKQLECAVCLEQYTEPKVLPCLHSFCKRCLEGLTMTREGAINCPTCRSSAKVSFKKLVFNLWSICKISFHTVQIPSLYTVNAIELQVVHELSQETLFIWV